MKIAVLSDLHLGSSPRVDQFGHVQDDFLLFLDRLESLFDRVVVNGDVYQTDHGLTPFARLEELLRIRERYSRLAARFDSPPYTVLAGNHDQVTVGALGTPERVDWVIDGLRLHFTHGHLHDPLLQWVPNLARWGSWVSGWVERLGMEGISRALEWLDSKKHSLPDAEKPGALLRSALRHLQDPGADVVVMGHTHRPTVLSLTEGAYLNSGSCSRGAFSWLEIDTQTRLFLHHRERL